MKSFLLLSACAAAAAAVTSQAEDAAIIREAATDCAACTLATAGVSQQIPEWLFAGLLEKCALLPQQLSSVCELGLAKLIDYITVGVQSALPNCEPLCANPTPVVASDVCALMHPYFKGLDGLFSDLQSSLIPALCEQQQNQHQCAGKIGGLLKMLEPSAKNIFKRAGHLLNCAEFKSQRDDGKLFQEWTAQKMLCTGCQSSLKLISLALSTAEDAFQLHAPIQEIFLSACQRIASAQPELIESKCTDATATLLRTLREDESAHDSLCQAAYDCPPIEVRRRDDKQEL